MSKKPVRRADDDEDDEDQGKNPISIVQNSRTLNTFHVRLDGYLERPSDFRGLLNVLELASEGDHVVIRLASGGGSVEIALAIRNALAETQAATTIVIDPFAASAATLWFNVVDNVVVQPGSYIMVHGASYGAIGHMSDIVGRVDFSERRIRSIFEEAYEGFLVQEEIEYLCNNQKDLYMEEDEILQRLENMAKHFENKRAE